MIDNNAKHMVVVLKSLDGTTLDEILIDEWDKTEKVQEVIGERIRKAFTRVQKRGD